MNNAQFKEWITYHQALFPGLIGWMEKLDNRNDVLQAWQDLIIQQDFEAMKAASYAMFSGREPSPFFGEHPTALVEICRRAQPDPRVTQNLQAKLKAAKEMSRRKYLEKKHGDEVDAILATPHGTRWPAIERLELLEQLERETNQ